MTSKNRKLKFVSTLLALCLVVLQCASAFAEKEITVDELFVLTLPDSWDKAAPSEIAISDEAKDDRAIATLCTSAPGEEGYFIDVYEYTVPLDHIGDTTTLAGTIRAMEFIYDSLEEYSDGSFWIIDRVIASSKDVFFMVYSYEPDNEFLDAIVFTEGKGLTFAYYNVISGTDITKPLTQDDFDWFMNVIEGVARKTASP